MADQKKSQYFFEKISCEATEKPKNKKCTFNASITPLTKGPIHEIFADKKRIGGAGK